MGSTEPSAHFVLTARSRNMGSGCISCGFEVDNVKGIIFWVSVILMITIYIILRLINITRWAVQLHM
jgi:hypothetical protein